MGMEAERFLTSGGATSTPLQLPTRAVLVGISGGGDGRRPAHQTRRACELREASVRRGASEGIRRRESSGLLPGALPGVPPPDPASGSVRRLPVSFGSPSPSLVLSPSDSGYLNLAEWLSIDPTLLALG